MQTQKMSLANIKGKLSRDEMKKIMAGSGEGMYRRGICNGGSPAWFYTTPVEFSVCSSDISMYCGGGGGGCFTTY